MPRNRFLEGLGRGVLRLGGWRMVGAFPDLPKFVLIAAPHSSNWDGVWGVAVKLAMGVKLSILGKDALVKLPLFGPLAVWQGVIGVDRTAAHGVVEQAVMAIRNADRMWFTIAPEGTRKWVERWKPGFWHIARTAGVPVVPVGFNGSYEILPKGRLLPQRGEIVIRIGAPIATDRYRAADKQALATDLHRAVQGLLDERHRA